MRNLFISIFMITLCVAAESNIKIAESLSDSLDKISDGSFVNIGIIIIGPQFNYPDKTVASAEECEKYSRMALDSSAKYLLAHADWFDTLFSKYDLRQANDSASRLAMGSLVPAFYLAVLATKQTITAISNEAFISQIELARILVPVTVEPVSGDSIFITEFPFDTMVYLGESLSPNIDIPIHRYGIQLPFDQYLPTICPQDWWKDFGLPKQPVDFPRFLQGRDCCGGTPGCTTWTASYFEGCEYIIASFNKVIYMKITGYNNDTAYIEFDTVSIFSDTTSLEIIKKHGSHEKKRLHSIKYSKNAEAVFNCQGSIIKRFSRFPDKINDRAVIGSGVYIKRMPGSSGLVIGTYYK